MATPSAGDTRTRLLEAAMSEFIEHGFAGTDTNRIARRAGFAPQTFYRWFTDKKAILTSVLDVWLEAERDTWRAVMNDTTLPTDLLVDACIDNMRPFLTFRQHLRSVLLNDPALNDQHAQSRRQLIIELAGGDSSSERLAMMASLLCQADALTEVLARGDITTMGLSDAPGRADLARLLTQLRSKHLSPSGQ
jgi:AcrR family transcriptional regulator